MYGPEEQGCARLWATVLSLAVNDIRLYARKHEVDLGNVESIRGLDASRAAAWIMSEETHGGGFLWVCDILELNPAFVRSKVLNGEPRNPRGPKKEFNKGEANADVAI